MPALYPVEEHLPTVNGLPRPYPDARRDADYHRHEILDHEHLESGVALRVNIPGTGYGVLGYFAHVLVPGYHPVLEVGVFIDEARYHNQCRQGVEHGEHPYPYHELLELVCLGAIVFHHRAYSEEGDEARRQEDGAEDQVDNQGD